MSEMQPLASSDQINGEHLLTKNPSQDHKGEAEIIKESAKHLRMVLVEQEFYKAYDRSQIWCVFTLVFVSNILINVDHGTLPGCSLEIQQAIGLDQAQFGTLGSIVYAGLVPGSAVATVAFEREHMIRPIMVLTLAMQSMSLFIFGKSSEFFFDACLRFAIGFFQVFSCIYMPVWADAFANEQQKSVWLTFLILASPLGIIVGFVMTSFLVQKYAHDHSLDGTLSLDSPNFIQNEGWRNSFYIQAILLIPCFLSYLVIPQKYLDFVSAGKYRGKCLALVHKTIMDDLNGQQVTESGILDDPIEDIISKLQDIDLTIDNKKQFIQKLKKKTLHYVVKEQRKLAEVERQNPGKIPFRQKLKSISSNPVFLSLMGSLCGLYYVVTGVQYWVPDYLKTILYVPAGDVTLYFAALTLSAPCGGVIIGGLCTSRLGGYNSPPAIKMQGVAGMLAVCCALPIPFSDTFAVAGTLLWGVLFFGGFVLPQVTGIMISSVGADQKASANSIANLGYSLFGYMPAPIVYGFLAQWTDTSKEHPEQPNQSRWAMGALLYSTIFTTSFLFYGLLKRIQQLQEEEMNKTLSPTQQSRRASATQDGEGQTLRQYDSLKELECDINNSQGFITVGEDFNLLQTTQQDKIGS